MNRSQLSGLAAAILATALVPTDAQPASGPAPEKAWVAESNGFTRELLTVQFAHVPEQGSAQGLAEYDTRVSRPTLADELAERHQLEAVLAKIKSRRSEVTDKKVQEDLDILFKAFDLQFRMQDFALKREVPFFNASAQIFAGLRSLLDDQVAPERRPAALVRLREYAGIEAGYPAFTDELKQYASGQFKKPGVIYPSKDEMQTELARNDSYLQGIQSLYEKYHLEGWQSPYARLKRELADYDAWLRTTILPKARTDFRLPPEKYALAFENYGIDISPAQIAVQARAAFKQYQSEMAPIAARVAAAHGFPSKDYRAVIAELKKSQITGEAILPFYEQRLKAIEKIIVERQLVTLPERPAIIRLATPAETAQEPAPHMVPPPLLHNTGQRGQFVLPLNGPATANGAEDRYDDFSFDAIAWTLIAHEARPGHELQFDSMVEQGVSLARALFAFNSTNVEGWGLYAEYIMQPYEPAEGQLCTLQFRLLRAARAFLDPELQSGAITPAQAYEVLQKDVLLSHAMAREEVERFTYRAPGQANSYFYGYTRLLSLRHDVEAALGAKFDAKRFHDFILSQGLLPPDLMRKALLQDFLPSQG
jgi:uncharacterized protein (DUF885 family)